MYLGWFDDNAKRTTLDKVRAACAAYRERFGVDATIVLMSADDYTDQDYGVPVRTESYVRRNNFWVGREECT